MVIYRGSRLTHINTSGRCGFLRHRGKERLAEIRHFMPICATPPGSGVTWALDADHLPMIRTKHAEAALHVFQLQFHASELRKPLNLVADASATGASWF